MVLLAHLRSGSAALAAMFLICPNTVWYLEFALILRAKFYPNKYKPGLTQVGEEIMDIWKAAVFFLVHSDACDAKYDVPQFT